MKIEEIKRKVEEEISSIKSEGDLQEVRVRLLGRKGLFSHLFEEIRTLPPESRRDVGKALNELRLETEERLRSISSKFEEEKRRGEVSKIDITLPGKIPLIGKKHPITITFEEIISIFVSLGFELEEGPEVELDYYNFEALNIPKYHPARDMQDTFYIRDDVVLRTHTSPVQIRTMEKKRPPIRIIAPGAVFRCDQDVSHTPMFHQVEGLMVDRMVRFSDLKGILTVFAKEMFGEDVRVRFRPSYFPFTEPSAEFDISCVICNGRGCRVCKDSGWLEILGSGMVHPQVLRNVGYDPEEYTGFAFGLGVERIAMIKFGIDDIRQFYLNDIRFLSQF